MHARGQAAGYTAPFHIPVERLPAAINSLLQPDIVVTRAAPTPPDFHARYSARRKIYSYTIDRAAYPQVLLARYAHHCPGPLNLTAIAEAARLLEGRHDFRAFQASGSEVRDTVRTLCRVELQELPGKRLLRLFFEGDGFLYRMVRLLAGSLLRVGRDRLKPTDLKLALEGRFPEAAGPTVPPRGLCLEQVIYE